MFSVQRLPDLCLRVGILYVLIGMTFGLVMGFTEDHSLRDVHAHLNLLGYVSTFLIGLFLKAYPAAIKEGIMRVSVWCIMIAVAVMLLLLAAYYLGMETAAMPLGLASIAVMMSYVLFAIAVFRVTK